MKEVDNVLRILIETKRAIEEDRPTEIKYLSNQTIHTATVSQDADNIIVSVLVYSISKILERGHYRRMEGWEEFYSRVIKNLSLAIKNLDASQKSPEEKDAYLKNFRNAMGRIRESVNKISSDLKNYIGDVFRKAEINKAFKLYEHGISSEQTAELLGVSLWDLSSYIGQSSISESKAAISMPEKNRIKIAEEIFK